MHSRVIFNSGCMCHILLDTIKEQCAARLDKAIRQRLVEIYEDVKQIKKKIRGLEVQKISQSRKNSVDTSQHGEDGKDGKLENDRLEKIENEINLKKEEQEKLHKEEKHLQADLLTVQSMDKVDIASQDGKSMALRKNRDKYAYTILTANDTYKLLKVDVDENGGETETTIEVNI